MPGSRRSVEVSQMDVTQAAVQPSLQKSERSLLDWMESCKLGRAAFPRPF